MDHDLHLDLAHLDDPDPPRFGAVRAEEAARLAARHQVHRARLLAVAVLAVAVLIGAGAIGLGQRRSGEDLEAAQPPVATAAEDPTTSLFPGVVPDGVLAPTSTVALPGATLPGPVTVPGGAAGGPGVTAPGAAAAAGPTTLPPVAPAGGVVPTTSAQVQATGQPPRGTVSTPAGLRLTLVLDASQVPAGGSIRGVIRFENDRSTAVTLTQDGCGLLTAGLYDGGGPTQLGAPSCPAQQSKVVAPGGVEQVDGGVFAEPSLRPGTYDAFATARVAEDGVRIHSERAVVTVVRP